MTADRQSSGRTVDWRLFVQFLLGIPTGPADQPPTQWQQQRVTVCRSHHHHHHHHPHCHLEFNNQVEHKSVRHLSHQPLVPPAPRLRLEDCDDVTLGGSEEDQ